MIDALSTPPNANAIVDQKITSLTLVDGRKLRALRSVADPNRAHADAPSVSSTTTGIHAATAPTLFSHLLTSSPTMFNAAASTSPASETETKNTWLVESACHDGPPMKSALAAAKYSSDGKYGRFAAQ